MRKKSFLLFIFLTTLCFMAPAATNMKGCMYVGVGKMEGNPIDFWSSIEFDGQDAEINVGNVFNFFAPYSLSGTGNTPSVTLVIPGSPKLILKSQDNGESFQGTLTINGKSIKLWLLKVAPKLKETTEDAEKLTEILSSPEGYTSFVQLSKAGGLFSVTSDFFFHKDGRFGISCDTPSLQQIFENLEGTFNVEGSEVKLNLDNGSTISGIIYDNGNYIKIPVGRKDGMDMTIILIR